MKILLISVIFPTVLSEGHINSLSSLRHIFGPGRVKNLNSNCKEVSFC